MHWRLASSNVLPVHGALLQTTMLLAALASAATENVQLLAQ
jgi:hypothetical protein